MSIVIANNDENGFYIISDTKISFSEDRYPCAIKEPLKTNIKKYGMVKSIILNQNFVFSYAGEDLSFVDFTISKIREEIYKNPFITPEKICELVKILYNHKENLTVNNLHKCDYILAFTVEKKIFLHSFKDKGIIDNTKKCYIGNTQVYKDFHDLDLNNIIPAPDCISKNKIYIEPTITIKFTPLGDDEQDTDIMKSKMTRLKEIVDFEMHDDVASPIIGVYYNTQRLQFEYLYDKIYEVHGELPMDGQPHSIIITPNSNGVSYDIIPLKYNKGILIYNFFLNYSVIYLWSNFYLEKGINDYRNLLLPIYFKGRVDDEQF